MKMTFTPQHTDCRSYAVIYEWVKGIDITQAVDEGILDERYMKAFTLDAEKRIKKKGFIVRDRKPHHIIIRPKKDDDLAKERKGDVLYTLVDFELLERTREREEMTKKIKRIDYLKRQKDRVGCCVNLLPIICGFKFVVKVVVLSYLDGKTSVK